MQASKLAFKNCSRTALFSPRTAHRGTSKMAAAAKYDVVVKGDPDTKKLTDCPFCQRVLITLANKGIEHDQTYVDFARKPDWLMQVSGGKVPVIRQSEKGLNMPDSDVIVEYLEKEHPNPSMKSSAPAELGGSLFPNFINFIKAPAEDKEATSKFEAELQAINDYLSKEGNGPLLGGANIDAKDAAVAPKLYHACVASKAIKGYDILEKYKAIKTYIDTLSSKPAFKQTLPADGDSVIEAGWKAKVASGWSH
ncbi:dehydroascorbate reductase [Dunaliella salina]|uniref:Dehydroascorbate reductase n=1 Tax=Dunaliella salina TaxID=3046 RepID=A0ABQ7FXW0_DUNSA|nr:dehydroascorbate reductase [Dunaliella salina]|eukprot:KAF5827157.1 dehydroascorbate reductase [Dunaliella salina]